MAEFLSQEEIDELLGIAEHGEVTFDENTTKIKYNENLKSFYKSKFGYDTEDEAKFRYYFGELNRFYTEIDKMQKLISDNQEKINKIKTEQADLFIKFSEELL